MRILVLAVLAALATASPGAALQTARVLLVDIDDVDAALVAEAATPTLDAVARAGRTFTRFHSMPLCSPTRAAMTLGALPSHPGNLVGTIFAPTSVYQLPVAGPLETLPQVVTGAGLTAAKVGKWHLRGLGGWAHPLQVGWQRHAGAMRNVTDYYDFPKVIDGVPVGNVRRYCTSDETDDALAEVRRGTHLISLSYHAAHKPYHLPPPSLYSGPAPTTERETARAVVTALDAELGRLLREALPAGYVVFLFADNGAPHSIGGGKGSVWQSGVHVPAWAIGRGVTPGVDDSLVSVVDVYDTALALLGIPHDAPNRGPSARSFAGALRGEPGPRRWLLVERFGTNGVPPTLATVSWNRAVVGERFKLVRGQGSALDRLFDLERDPGEQVDLLTTGAPLTPAAGNAHRVLSLIMNRG